MDRIHFFLSKLLPEPIMSQRVLTALPVYNEARHIPTVLGEVQRFSQVVLVVDDGSSDGTGELLRKLPGILVETHVKNRGYGAALRTAFEYAQRNDYDVVVTIDCDGQHEPRRIPLLVDALDGYDIVSGSRYMAEFPGDNEAPPERKRINQQLTTELNRRLCLNLTDAFCGFKAYRVSELGRMHITENGYAMPLELWVQAAHQGLRIREFPVPRIYLDEKRSFGGVLDTASMRSQYYHLVLDRSMAAIEREPGRLWSGTLCGECQ